MNYTSASLARRCSLLAVVASLAAACQPLNAAEPVASLDTNAPSPELLTWQKEYGPTHDQRMKWWRAARFGMFIHWGVYSVPAGVWNGTNVTASGAEWIMNRGRIPVSIPKKPPAISPRRNRQFPTPALPARIGKLA